MKLLGRESLYDFFKKHAEARAQIESWIAEVDGAQWNSSSELKSRYPSASVIDSQHVIFNICRNKYRLWVMVSYKNRIVFIKKIGTHKEYDKWTIG